MRANHRTTLAIAYFVAATCALIWPLYPCLGNHVEPRLLGLPWSLTYVLLFIVANTIVLAALYYSRWLDEGEDEGGDEGEARVDTERGT